MANAIKMLQDDHNKVRMLCKQLPTIQNGARDEEELAGQAIVSLLRAHSTLEEELVYPVLADSHPDLVQHAVEEHAEAKAILDEIEEIGAGPGLREVVLRLQESLEAHVAEEEETVFPLLTEVLGIDGLENLGMQMLTRNQELMQEAPDTTGMAATGQPKNIYPKM